jgi:hypothetical protein
MKLFVLAATQLAVKVFRYRIILLYLLLESISGFTQNMAIGEWRIAVPYSNAKGLTEGKDFVYCVANTFYFGYHKEQRYSINYDKVGGLSDVDVSIAAYHPDLDILLVAYQNTNIDLIKGNNIINIADIRRSSITGKKTINSVHFHNNLAYLSCGFGIVVLDLVKEEIKETYYIGPNGNQTEVFGCAVSGNYIYAATAIGVQRANINSPNLANFQIWELQTSAMGIPAKPATDIEMLNDEVLAVVMDSLYKWDDNTWSFVYQDTAYAIENIRATGGKLMICEFNNSISNSRIKSFDGATIEDFILSSSGYGYIKDILIVDDSSIYIADNYIGLFNVRNGQRESLNPNGPATVSVSRIAIKNAAAWISSGNTSNIFLPPLISRYESNWWNIFNEYNINGLSEYQSIIPIAFNAEGNKIYLGSYNKGIVELNRDGSLSDTFTVYNTTMEGTVGDDRRCKVGGIAFDANGNMWVTNMGASRFLSVRKYDGTWRSFKPVNASSAASVTEIIIDDYGQKWMLATESGTDGIVVFSEGSDIDNTTDDVGRALRKGTGLGNLPSNNVFCIAKDRDGEIWIGTDAGIAVFYCPGSVLTENGCDAQEILVTAADGFVGTLLGSERVQAIAVDGANRKWVGTTNGLWLFSPDGTQQIHYFSTENAPLISNNITALAIDPESGVLYVGTEKGLMLYRSDATEAEETPEKSGVLVFPNPVKENYYGPIAIKGLAQDADVKITDVSGALAFQTKALGGQAIWDGRDGTGNYAKAGVYLVFTAGEEGKSKLVTKVLVMR